MRDRFTSTVASPEREDLAGISDRLQEEFVAMGGKHLLVTGAAGFLGYYLIRSVLFHNALDVGPPIQVTALDNYSRGLPRWLSATASSPHLTVAEHDIIEPLPDSAGRHDFIVHAASIASPTFYRQNPIATMDANVTGLRRLLDSCRDRLESAAPVEGMLFFSTSEVYGDPTPENIPTPETYRGNVSCTGPRACYDESKRYGETLCVNFASEYGLPIRIVRPFNNYGPGLKIDDGRLLSDLAQSVLEGRDIVMYSDGSPTRTFCYIADAIVGYYKALVRGRNGVPYNIGAEAPEVSVGEMAERVAALARELTGYEGGIVHEVHPDRDYLVENPNRRCPKIDRARDELGFEALVPLDVGLRNMLTWYQQQTTARQDRPTEHGSE